MLGRGNRLTSRVSRRVAADGRDRQKLYAGGGIFSVTSRILVVDLLTGIALLNLLLKFLACSKIPFKI